MCPIFLVVLGTADGASNEWVWLKGSDTVNQSGIYNTQGVSDSANTPGARHSSVSWADNTGNLWLFGGRGYSVSQDVYLNDLWKYDPATNQWTWIKGSNVTEQSGIYGTQGIAAPANNPGSRSVSESWTVNAGYLWLFGGYGHTVSEGYGYMNDVWKYDLATNQWTWTKGRNIAGEFGVYGTQGIAAPANTPGARETSVSWTDTAGNLWLFGGKGFYTTMGNTGYYNDLWKYTTNTPASILDWALFEK